ncbi:MAG: hypothetical protein ABI277_02190 [Burkholderiaceae bacterium]
MAKLTILVEKKDGLLKFGNDRTIMAHFNPNRLTFSKSANWSSQPAAQRDTPELQFTNSDPRTLSIDLLFDTYDRPGKTKDDVRDITNPLLSLTTVEGHGEDKHRPPVCRLMWDRAGLIFQGVVQSIEQTFTLFMDNGLPVRASIRCTFKEWRTNDEDQRRQNKKSADLVKSRVLKRGDTLAAIAADEYRDPRLWRPIAIASGIEDPLELAPGIQIRVPILKNGA